MKELMSLLDLNVGPRLDMPDEFLNDNGSAHAHTWASNEDLLPSCFIQFYLVRLRKHYFK